ncbi:MAG: hypothetical protein O2913_13845 [Chloroflexi bacterium]|nr:hypothetical protein [Chloroflexota bacterium]
MEFTEFLDGQLDLFRQRLMKLAEQLGSGDLTPEDFRKGFGELKKATGELGAASFVALVEQSDGSASEIVEDGSIYRHKQVSCKEWLTPWGKVEVRRRLYQQDRGGTSYVPLDHRCGMVGRFMTPDIEEVCVLLGTNLVPAEVEEALARVYPEGPSRKAIQKVLAKAGACIEAHADDMEAALNRTAPLNTRGDVLVAGWDGSMVPLREPAPKRGRPAERPGVRNSNQGLTAWKEAGVGMVAVYELPLDPATQDAKRLDVRYCAHMPEPKMVHVVDQVTDLAHKALHKGTFDYKVFIADGKKEIWTTVEKHPLFSTFTPILDFYHAATHLSTVAEAMFGKKAKDADRWYKRWRHKLKHEPGAVKGLLRSLQRYRKLLSRGSAKHQALTREIGYFLANRNKMDYASYQSNGLPIGSGPIEAACKTILGQRLKRSGMRWTRTGGQHVLNLRAPLKSNRWDALWDWYLNHTTKLAEAA